MMVTESQPTKTPATSDAARDGDRRRSHAVSRFLVAPGERVVRAFYGSIAVVLAATLVAQCMLTHREGRSLVNTFSYFTIQSNLLVLIAAAVLALRPSASGPAWRVLRLGSLTGITVTGLVYATVLAPYVHLTGWAMVYNCVFHYVMPAASVLGFVLVGPRLRLRARDLVFMVWPVLWLVATMLRGALLHPEFTGFSQAPSHYPYEFLDVDRVSLVEVVGSIAFVSAAAGRHRRRLHRTVAAARPPPALTSPDPASRRSTWPIAARSVGNRVPIRPPVPHRGDGWGSTAPAELGRRGPDTSGRVARPRNRVLCIRVGRRGRTTRRRLRGLRPRPAAGMARARSRSTPTTSPTSPTTSPR